MSWAIGYVFHHPFCVPTSLTNLQGGPESQVAHEKGGGL